jgi:hypothetical protein
LAGIQIWEKSGPQGPKVNLQELSQRPDFSVYEDDEVVMKIRVFTESAESVESSPTRTYWYILVLVKMYHWYIFVYISLLVSYWFTYWYIYVYIHTGIILVYILVYIHTGLYVLLVYIC